MKVRTTLIGGEKKMLVWNDLEADEKIRVYDKGVSMTEPAKAPIELLVSYRSGDMWAPQVEQIEALRAETGYFADCIETDRMPFNDGSRRPARRANAGGRRAVDSSKRGD